MKKFSIILPVKNGGELIKACIESILSQTNQDFNLLVLENCSTDYTKEWLQSLNNDKIKIFPSDRPLTIEENWARIKDVRKNEFITLIGHDDLLDENYLAEMNDIITKHPLATLYQSHFRFIDADGFKIKKCRRMKEQYSGAEYLEAILTNSLDTMGTGYMMRSKDYDQIGGIPAYPNLLFADHELWIRLASLNYMAVIEKECFSYRLNQSVSKLTGAAKYIDAFFMFLNFLLAFGRNGKDTKETIKKYSPAYIKYYCTSLTHRLLKTPIAQRNDKTVNEFILKCKEKADQLSPGNNFNPQEQYSLWLSRFIDGNYFLKRLYLLFKKVFKKNIYS